MSKKQRIAQGQHTSNGELHVYHMNALWVITFDGKPVNFRRAFIYSGGSYGRTLPAYVDKGRALTMVKRLREMFPDHTVDLVMVSLEGIG